jgi:hypothetical protein
MNLGEAPRPWRLCKPATYTFLPVRLGGVAGAATQLAIRRCICWRAAGDQSIRADGRRSMPPYKGGALTTTAAMGNWSIN